MYTTARDLAIMGAAAAENGALCQILTTPTYTLTEQTTGRTISVRNIDRLVNEPKSGDYEKVHALYTWCIGGKTGSTNAAGRTYMAMARYSGVTLVCVLLGDKVPTTSTKGTAGDPYTVAEALEKMNAQRSGWVTGYVVGAVAPEVTEVKSNADIEWKAPTTLANTLVTADAADVTDYTKCIMIELSKAVGENVGLKSFGYVLEVSGEHIKTVVKIIIQIFKITCLPENCVHSGFLSTFFDAVLAEEGKTSWINGINFSCFFFVGDYTIVKIHITEASIFKM
jgi:hypothetical protein